MAITVNTNEQINVSVSVNGGSPISYTTNATSVSVSQPSVINVSVSSKGPKGDPGTGGGVDQIYYTNLEATPTTVGGIPSGSTFQSQTMQQMWDALLYPYLDPAFTSFYISGQEVNIECGDTIAANPTFVWAASNSSNIEPGTVAIIDQTAVQTVSSGNNYGDSPLSTTYGAVGLNAPGTYFFKVQAENTNSEILQKTKSYAFWFRFYAGPNTSETLNETQIEALQVSNLGPGGGTYTLNALSDGYKFFAFPIYSGAFQPSSIKLDNGTNVPMVTNEGSYTTSNGNGFYYDTVSVENAFGVTTNYAVYRTSNILNGQTIITVS